MIPLHHHSRACSASPKPPIHPPRPHLQCAHSLILASHTPPPPPRRYQLIQLQNESKELPPLAPDIHAIYRGDYENANVIGDDIARVPVIVKYASDDRRKQYYFNGLNLMPRTDLSIFAEENEFDIAMDGKDGGNGPFVVNDVKSTKNTQTFNANLTSNNSLDEIVWFIWTQYSTLMFRMSSHVHFVLSHLSIVDLLQNEPNASSSVLYKHFFLGAYYEHGINSMFQILIETIIIRFVVNIKWRFSMNLLLMFRRRPHIAIYGIETLTQKIQINHDNNQFNMNNSTIL